MSIVSFDGCRCELIPPAPFDPKVYGLSVIRDPTLVDSRVAKDTVIVGQKYEESPVKEVAESNYDASFMLRSTEVGAHSV